MMTTVLSRICIESSVSLFTEQLLPIAQPYCSLRTNTEVAFYENIFLVSYTVWNSFLKTEPYQPLSRVTREKGTRKL